jgi:glycosyltransferase involved in cell wall biosynthesis
LYAVSHGSKKLIKVIVLIPALSSGGAERQVVELVKGLDKTRFDVTLVTFYDGGALESEAEGEAGVSVISLQKRGREDVLGFLGRLWRTVSRARPDVMLGYMGLASDLCLIVGRAAGAKVVWNLRASYVDYALYDWRLHWTFRAGAWLSHFVDLIIVNSEAGRKHHVAHGYAGARMVVIPNGIDTRNYRPDPVAGERMRLKWGINRHDPVIGLVGRLDPMKDHPTFLHAAAELATDLPGVRFVCVGTGSPGYEAELRALSATLGLQSRLVWAGRLDEMVAVYNALDILASSSYGEGFSNAIGEAMACGVPCVVTDVGDSRLIVSDLGTVVPARDPAAMAKAWHQWLNLSENERRTRGAQGRSRIEREFDLKTMIRRTAAALEGLLMPPAHP